MSHLRLVPPPKEELAKVDVGQNTVWQAQAGCLLSLVLLPFGAFAMIPWFFLQKIFVRESLSIKDVWGLYHYPYRQVMAGWVFAAISVLVSWFLLGLWRQT